MEHEYQVLTHLQENELTTQRKISSRTGLSLGAVNLLLKKMARKGLVKVEKLNTRTVRYILTPKGLQEKARLTYSYIRLSYQRLLQINRALDDLLTAQADHLDSKPVIIFGPADEIREIITQHLNEKGHLFNIYEENGLPEDKSKTPPSAGLTLTWREEEEKRLKNWPHAVNIMKLI